MKYTLKTLALTAMFLVMPIALRAQFDFKIEGRSVQIHSFGSQGFAYSNQNNFLTMKTSDGSFAMTDGGVNISTRLTDRLRVGAQVYIANVGEFDKWHPQLDWAFLDYRFKDWFGVRGGKVKTALGLYNDTQDMTFLYTWALLPQSLYPVDLRDNNIAHTGGDVYGDISLRKAGSLSYTGYAGTLSNNKRGGYYYSLADSGLPIKSQTASVYGADLRWNTRVPGLMAGASWMNRDLTIDARELAYGGAILHGETQPEHITSVYADYTRDKLHLSGEYRVDHENFAYTVLGNAGSSDSSTYGWFGAGSYRLWKHLELGSYYSRFHVDNPTTTAAAANHIFDKVVSARFDLTKYWNVKVEGHFMDGYGDPYSAHGFYLRSNPSGLKPTTNMLILRTGVNF